MVFIGSEKTYDMIPREEIWHVLEKTHVHKRYIDVIKDMYNGVITSLRTIAGETDTFPITIGLNQGFALSIYMYPLVIADTFKMRSCGGRYLQTISFYFMRLKMEYSG